jgi:acetyl esterase/lipase
VESTLRHGGIKNMDIKRSSSQPSDKEPVEHVTSDGPIDPLFEVPDLASARHLSSSIERPSDAAGVFAIYPGNGIPPGSEKWTWYEQTMHVPMPGRSTPMTMVRNVVLPTLTLFRPAEGTANGTSLIVAPGGAFRFLTMDSEGYDMAHWLTQLGVTVFVLRYRLAHMPENDAEMLTFMHNLMNVLPLQSRTEEKPPVGDEATEQARTWAEEDGRQTIRFVRQHAEEWALDPNRIGIAGFSAGGGIVISAAMQHDVQSRPDFAAGIYPGYTTATPVPEDAPPLFLAIADDDILVAPISAARLYEAWHKAGKPVELHIFVRGYHGFGMQQQHLPSDQWIDLFKNWLAAQGYLFS